jgi:hypothetical protein
MSYLQMQRNQRKRGGQFVYVHLARSVWDAVRGRSVQRRAYLGRLEASGERLVLSKGYALHRGAAVELAELKRRLAVGEDIEAWLRAPVGGGQEIAPGGDAPVGVSIVGDAYVLLHLAREIGLAALVEEAFGVEDGLVLLGLALHQAAKGGAVYLAGDWLDEREVPVAMRGELLQTDRVYGLIAGAGADPAKQGSFFRGWIAAAGKPEALIYDITSISTYARDLELAEYGYNRDGENLPQINLALVRDSRSGTPLWYRPLPGSIPDVSTLKRTGAMLKDLGLERFNDSLDRGFYSQTNLRTMLEENIGFTLGVPFSVAQAVKLVRRYRSALNSPKHSFPFHERVMRHVRDVWRVNGTRGHSRELDAHLFFEPARQIESMTRLETAVFALEAKAADETLLSRRDAGEWLNENAGALRSCLAVRAAGERFRIERNARAVALAASRMGFPLVLTNARDCPREEVLARSRGRDRIEKLLDTLKNEDGQHRLRTGNDRSVVGRLFVAFLALVLHSELERRMGKAGPLRQMSVVQFIAHMRKIKSVRMASGTRHLLEITKRNRLLQLLSRASHPCSE